MNVTMGKGGVAAATAKCSGAIILAAALFAALPGSSHAQTSLCPVGTPWIVAGSTVVPAGGSASNPTPNKLGRVGEVISLPYTVPEGYQLTIRSARLDQTVVTAVAEGWLEVYVAAGDFLKMQNSLFSLGVTYYNQANNYSDLGDTLPASSVLNVYLQQSDNAARVMDWGIAGCLIPAAK